MRRSKSVSVLAALVVAASFVSGAATGTALDDSAEAGAAGGARADDGAQVVTTTIVDSRTLDLTVQSPALGRSGMVRLLLPLDRAAGVVSAERLLRYLRSEE